MIPSDIYLRDTTCVMEILSLSLPDEIAWNMAFPFCGNIIDIVQHGI